VRKDSDNDSESGSGDEGDEDDTGNEEPDGDQVRPPPSSFYRLVCIFQNLRKSEYGSTYRETKLLLKLRKKKAPQPIAFILGTLSRFLQPVLIVQQDISNISREDWRLFLTGMSEDNSVPR